MSDISKEKTKKLLRDFTAKCIRKGSSCIQYEVRKKMPVGDSFAGMVSFSRTPQSAATFGNKGYDQITLTATTNDCSHSFREFCYIGESGSAYSAKRWVLRELRNNGHDWVKAYGKDVNYV